MANTDRDVINVAMGGSQDPNQDDYQGAAGGGQYGGGTPTPTPTPAPSFTTQPTISPSSGTAGVTTFTGNDGVIANGNATSRRWLLGGTAMSTAQTFAPQSAGSLVFEVTATGAGGTTAATSAAVTVADPTPTPTPANTWTQRRTTTVNSDTAQTDYQVPIDLTSANFDFASAKADGSDIRVTAADGTTLLPYWIEAFDPTAQTARVWVKVPSVGAGSTTLQLYYSNPQATTTQNGDATFLFFDDFAGVPGWNRYKVVNPIITTEGGTWKSNIVGDPMVIPPDAGANEWGAFYFGAANSTGDVGYMRSLDGGLTWIDGPSNPVFTHTQAGSDFAIKPSVFYDAGTYHMAYASKAGSGNWTLRRATATARSGPWTDQGVLLTANGGAIEGNRVDCPCWFRDQAGVVRLYYSGNEAVSNEPRNFNLATATSPTGPFTRSASNPLAVPNPAISWQSTGLGGMSVRQLSGGTFDIAYNAFDVNGISWMGRTASADGVTLNLQASDLLFDRGPPGAWDRVKLYRPCIYNTGTGPDRLLYNALGDTENIGYAELTSTINTAKWTPVLQGLPTLNFASGALTIDDANAGSSSYFTMTSSQTPGTDVAVETRFRVDELHGGGSEYAPFILNATSAATPFPNGSDNQFVFATGTEIRHQNRSGGSWGGEDTIAPLAVGQFLRSKVTKRATSMDYEIRNAAGTVTGSINGNTDAPQGATLPLSFGSRGSKATHDWYLIRKAAVTAPTASVGTATTVSVQL